MIMLKRKMLIMIKVWGEKSYKMKIIGGRVYSTGNTFVLKIS